MKTFGKLSLMMLSAVALTACVVKSASESSTDAQEQTMYVATEGLAFADPFILLDGGTYYAYGTMGDRGIEVYSSSDLKYWEHKGLALDKKDSYAERWFWAPEVYKVGNRYLMYYSAEERICVAEAESPVGPFVQKQQVPMYDNGRSIDNSLFIDADGTPYLYFDRVYDDAGLKVYVAKVNPDLLTIDESSIKLCIERSQDWEVDWVNEGSFVTKHGDTYYMTYSGNGYTNPGYGIGVATAKSPEGPWTKYEKNPILQFPETKDYGRLEGVGHSAMFRDKDGNLRIVFHAHYKPGEVHPREMYISTVSFTDDEQPLMQISTENIFKALVKKQ